MKRGAGTCVETHMLPGGGEKNISGTDDSQAVPVCPSGKGRSERGQKRSGGGLCFLIHLLKLVHVQ
jgi:hypothetical protein